MTKVLLVEDDNNLREIYEARLQAEGYTIVSAHDGEEALVVAKAEKPDLIISDVMMPKISGFEMLDILRNTDSLKNVKVIMLTALGQSDDQQRADKLGADRYLVKSQVTLEDIVNVANELVKPSGGSTPGTTTIQPPATTPPPAAPPSEPPSSPAPTQTLPSTPPTEPTPVAPPPLSPEPVANQPAPTEPATTSIPVIEPVALSTEPPKVTPLLQDKPLEDKESAESESQEENDVKNQIDNFANNDSTAVQDEESVPSGRPHVIDPTKPPETPGQDQTIIEPTQMPSTPKDNIDPQYSPQPVGKKVIEPLADTDPTNKPDITTLLDREAAQAIVDAPGAAAVITPDHQTPIPSNNNGVDPNSIAL